ncbi:hypothetical protein DSO57_1033859 [Entomophthora muscae]|uniref:Uncharacterized protein n=1 Tax=Entomophthora muscae TaxID=34485 RepID=A0ACC2TBB5_9FUNG|nr:hypothetical protein DSO57_1033859 [Entomophthora muscae]
MKTEGFPFLTDIDLTFTLGRPFEVHQNRIVLLDDLAPGKVFCASSENLILSPLDLWQTVLGVEGDYKMPDF